MHDYKTTQVSPFAWFLVVTLARNFPLMPNLMTWYLYCETWMVNVLTSEDIAPFCTRKVHLKECVLWLLVDQSMLLISTYSMILSGMLPLQTWLSQIYSFFFFYEMLIAMQHNLWSILLSLFDWWSGTILDLCTWLVSPWVSGTCIWSDLCNDGQKWGIWKM